MSQDQENKPESEGWWEKNANWIVLLVRIIVPAGLLLFLYQSWPWSWWSDLPEIFRLLGPGYLLLTASLLAIWLFGIPLNSDKNADLEFLAKTRNQGTLAILGMVTLLGIASLIAWTVTQYNQIPKTASMSCPVTLCTAESTTRCACPGSETLIPIEFQEKDPALSAKPAA